ncbi:putative membrane protein (plasmid) [Clostridium botulinum]|nr:putative membrane protein [Clostridium botulinum]
MWNWQQELLLGFIAIAVGGFGIVASKIIITALMKILFK